MHSIWDSTIRYQHTISPRLGLDEPLASPALPLPDENWTMEDTFRIVTAKTKITETRTSFLTSILADTLIHYKDTILTFGLDLTPDSFPFRELCFDLVSIASDQAKFHSFPAQPCDPRDCKSWPPGICSSKHLPRSPGWLKEEWTGQKAPLLEFGSLSHRPGEPAGASPADTIYWHENVLISLALVADGDAVLKAANWGLAHGKTHFQIAVLSLFKVSLAEVSGQSQSVPLIKSTRSIDLSPIRASDCTSTHSYHRPERRDRMSQLAHPSDLLTQADCALTIQQLESQFPGLAAMVNFFEVAANRHSAFTAVGILPAEIYQRITDFIDFDTWRECRMASIVLRSCCLRDHRLNDRTAIVRGPLERRQNTNMSPRLSFDLKDMETHRVSQVVKVLSSQRREELENNFMPVIGDNRKAIMVNVSAQFKAVE